VPLLYILIVIPSSETFPKCRSSAFVLRRQLRVRFADTKTKRCSFQTNRYRHRLTNFRRCLKGCIHLTAF